MKAFKKFLIILGISILAIILVVGLSLFAFIRLLKSGNMPFNLITTTSTDRTIIIEEELHNMGFLVTQEYCATIIKDFADASEFFGVSIPGTSRRAIFSYDVDVSAGVDFEDINVTIDDFNHEIAIALPAAQLYGEPVMSTDSFECYLDETGLFVSGFNLEDHNDMIDDILDSAEDRAIEIGILDKANENAREIVTNLVYGMIQGIEEYENYDVIVTSQSNRRSTGKWSI